MDKQADGWMEACEGSGMDEWVGHCSCPGGVEQGRVLEQGRAAGEHGGDGAICFGYTGNYIEWPVLK